MEIYKQFKKENVILGGDYMIPICQSVYEIENP